LESASFALIPHRFTPKLERLRKFGIYNVGWVGARNDKVGAAAVKWWRSKCVEWCYDYVDGDRFADQGYLQTLPTQFSRVKVIENLGANLAPWNLGNYRIEYRAGEVLIDAINPLVFFHFQGLKKGMGFFIFNSHRKYGAPFCQIVRAQIYKPYVDELLAIEKTVSPMLGFVAKKSLQRSKIVDFRHFVEGVARQLRERAFQLFDVAAGRVFIVFHGRAH
jgi:hypothetical protein